MIPYGETLGKNDGPEQSYEPQVANHRQKFLYDGLGTRPGTAYNVLRHNSRGVIFEVPEQPLTAQPIPKSTTMGLARSFLSRKSCGAWIAGTGQGTPATKWRGA